MRNKSTTQTSYANDFVNSKSQYAREKPLLTGYKQGTVITCTSVRYFIHVYSLKRHTLVKVVAMGLKQDCPLTGCKEESFLKLAIRES